MSKEQLQDLIEKELMEENPELEYFNKIINGNQNIISKKSPPKYKDIQKQLRTNVRPSDHV